VNEWLTNYTVGNVFVFDFYNVLTSNGGNANTNDVALESGNHHRCWNGVVQHKTDGDDDASPNTLEYPTEDDHPSIAGNQKATAEFVGLLNNAYNSHQTIPEFKEFTVLPIFITLMLAVALLSKRKISVHAMESTTCTNQVFIPERASV
jgi:hypothetical protein